MRGKNATSGKGTNSTFGSRRTMNPTSAPGGRLGRSPDNTKTFQQMDAKRRQGDFEGTGEHARTGNRGHQ
jgi:hypothetical protein